MPFNPQAKGLYEFCPEILVKPASNDDQVSIERDLSAENENIEIVEGKWDDEQNLKFVLFIDFHSTIFVSKEKRKSQKIFKIFSTYMQNRTAAQCRSHYQKLMIKFKTVAKLKRYFRQFFGQDLYSKRLQEFQQSWKSLHIFEDKPQIAMKETAEMAVQTDFLPEMSYDIYCQIMAMWQFELWRNWSFYCQNQSA